MLTPNVHRPQCDGPALRAITLITYANFLLDSNASQANTLWPIIQLDLDYVSNNWNKTGQDLIALLDGI